MTPKNLTAMLRAAASGDGDAAEAAYAAVYQELRSLARRQLRRRPGALDATELVHEAYLKISQGQSEEIADRGHFLCLAARVMRQVLVDEARTRMRLKRGGGAEAQTLDESHAVGEAHAERVLAVDQALGRLADDDPRLPVVVECKFFAGLTEPEAAEAMGVSERTVRRLWNRARELLRDQLRSRSEPDL